MRVISSSPINVGSGLALSNLHCSINLNPARFKLQLQPTNFPLFLWKSGTVFYFCYQFLPWEDKPLNLQIIQWVTVVVCVILKTLGSPFLSFSFTFFFLLMKKMIKLPLLRLHLGGFSFTCPIPSLHCRITVGKTCLGIQVGVTSQCSCLFDLSACTGRCKSQAGAQACLVAWVLRRL